LTDLLRGELNFQGVIVSDDLGMKAVADRYPIEELAVRSVRAGADVLLIRGPIAAQTQAFAALLAEAERDSAFAARVRESAARVATMKAACRVGLPASGALEGSPEHRRLAASFPTVDPRSPVAASPVVDA
jgi:beta-N-acetylhexosaminidase